MLQRNPQAPIPNSPLTSAHRLVPLLRLNGRHPTEKHESGRRSGRACRRDGGNEPVYKMRIILCIHCSNYRKIHFRYFLRRFLKITIVDLQAVYVYLVTYLLVPSTTGAI